MYEELDIIDESFELQSNVSGDGIQYMPLMEEYPNADNTFDIFSGIGGLSPEMIAGMTDAQLKLAQEEADKGRTIDPKAITGAIEGVTGLIALFGKTEAEQMLKTTCGGRPLLAKNRTRWQSCADNFFSQQAGRYGFAPNQMGRYPYTPTYTPPKQGLSTGAWVGIGVGTALVIGTIIYFSRGGKLNTGKA